MATKSLHLLLDDLSPASTTTITAGSEASADQFPATHLGDEIAHSKWRSTSLCMKHTQVNLDAGSDTRVGMFSLGNTNSHQLCRANVRRGSTVPPERIDVAPTSTPSTSGGLTGTHSDVDDDPYSPDANAIEATSDAQQTARLGFPMTGSLDAKTEMQFFAVLMTAPAGGALTLDSVTLYDNGVSVRQLLPTTGGEATSNYTIAAGDDRMYFGYWTSGEVATALELEIKFSGGTPTDGDGRIEAVRWYKLRNETGITAYDWMRVFPADISGLLETDLHPADRAGLGRHWAMSPTEDNETLRYAVIEIDDQFNPDGYVEAGGAAFGPAWFVDRMPRGAQSRMVNHEVHPRRELKLPLDMLSESEASQLGEWMGTRDRRHTVIIPIASESALPAMWLPLWAEVGGSAVDVSHVTQSAASDRRYKGSLTLQELR